MVKVNTTRRHQVRIHCRPRGQTINMVFRQDCNPDTGHRGGGDDHRILIGRPTNMIFSAKWNVKLFSMLGLLLGLIQIKYQNKKSPFETHKTIVEISIAALGIYVSAAATAYLAKSIVSKEVEEQPNDYYRLLNVLGFGFDILGLVSAVVSLSCLVFGLILDGTGWIVFVPSVTILVVLVVALIFLFLCIIRPNISGQGAGGPTMV